MTKAISNVRPSSQVLRDSMNFNSYVKIKIINWRDHSKSAYVNGVVISNYLADRHMQHSIDNPTILILKDSLNYIRNDTLLDDMHTIIAQEKY